MNVSDFIARRYLLARRSLGVINIISMISAAGIAIGCAALVIILSIYNGFDSIVRQMNDSFTADILVQPASGKTLDASAEAFSRISSDPRVKALCPVVEENVFIQYEDRHVVATAKGVADGYEEVTGLKDHICDGAFELRFGEIDQMVLGRTIAMKLQLSTAFVSPLEVYFPSRVEKVDLLDPLSTLHKERLFPGGIVSLEQVFDQKYVFVPLATMRRLLEYDTEASSVEIFLNPDGIGSDGFASRSVLSYVSDTLGGGYVVKDRRQQNQMLYKLLRYEKIAIYLILLFVMVIITFNIFSSLSMLIIEKCHDVEILRSMGADDAMVSRIFVMEGCLVSLSGIIAGTLLGLAVCLLQQRFGFVKMPGNFVISAYPVVIRWTDILITVAGVGLIGFLVSLLTKAQKL